MSPFKTRIFQIIKVVPYGTVVSYGQVAAYAGFPRAARQVGWMLHQSESNPQEIPWWRVVNNQGYLSIRGTNPHDKNLQQKLLQAEGIEMSGEYTLSMEQYRFRPTKKQLRTFQLGETYITFLLEKYRV